MTSALRVYLACRRKLPLVVLVAVCMLLGYTGVAVMKSSYYLPYGQMILGSPDAQGLQGATRPPQGDNVAGEVQEARDGGKRPGPLVVLVLSSMPRGGSTLLVELLSAIQDSVVLFEPLWLIEKTKCYEDEACVTSYLRDAFSCSFKQDFETWLKNKGLFFHYFSEQARRCLGKKDDAKAACLNDMNLRALCETAPVVLVKVIRARLAWLHKMLEDSLINLKVIHLTRDPRGSLNSITRFGWDKDPHSRCTGLEDDLITYKKVKQVFPAKVMQVHYEHLCLAPLDITKDIFRFLYANATLPNTVNTFLEKHMLSGVKKDGTMSTFKNSTQEFQAWRLKINEKYLNEIEKEPTCQRSISLMGHALFGSLTAAKDLSQPLILNNPPT